MSPIAAFAQIEGEKVGIKGLYYSKSDEQYFVEEYCEKNTRKKKPGDSGKKNERTIWRIGQ